MGNPQLSMKMFDFQQSSLMETRPRTDLFSDQNKDKRMTEIKEFLNDEVPFSITDLNYTLALPTNRRAELYCDSAFRSWTVSRDEVVSEFEDWLQDEMEPKSVVPLNYQQPMTLNNLLLGSFFKMAALRLRSCDNDSRVDQKIESINITRKGKWNETLDSNSTIKNVSPSNLLHTNNVVKVKLEDSQNHDVANISTKKIEMQTNDLERNCEQCDVKGSEAKLQDHVNLLDTTVVLQCDICQRVLAKELHLKIHQQMHNNDSSYSCTMLNCEETFINEEGLNTHIKFQHHSRTRKKCDICNFTLCKSKPLTYHLGLHFPTVYVDCSVCNIRLETEESCYSHMTCFHEKEMKTIRLATVCSICQQPFFDIIELRNHCVKNHSSFKGFPCELCGKLCANMSTLKYHKQSHHTIRVKKEPFQCPVCCREFLRKAYLDRHLLEKHRPWTDPPALLTSLAISQRNSKIQPAQYTGSLQRGIKHFNNDRIEAGGKVMKLLYCNPSSPHSPQSQKNSYALVNNPVEEIQRKQQEELFQKYTQQTKLSGQYNEFAIQNQSSFIQMESTAKLITYILMHKEKQDSLNMKKQHVHSSTSSSMKDLGGQAEHQKYSESRVQNVYNKHGIKELLKSTTNNSLIPKRYGRL